MFMIIFYGVPRGLFKGLREPQTSLLHVRRTEVRAGSSPVAHYRGADTLADGNSY